MNTEEQIQDVLTRGVGTLVDPEGKFKEKLVQKAAGKYPNDIIVKFGVDPTRADIHIGHAVVFRKLKKLQDLGCKIVFLIGDYTAQIGDPTGKNKTRPEINQEEVAGNAKSFLQQISVFLDVKDESKYQVLTNSSWFQSPLDFRVETIEEASKLWFKERDPVRNLRPDKKLIAISLYGLMFTLRHLTFARLIERDMFQERLRNGNELYMHEMMYPVLQGIDSYAITEILGGCDLEIGGTDQTFNMLIGRDVQKMNRQEQQAVLSVELLEGLDGKEKMSKSLDNYIAITDTPNDMYGKVMSIPDSLIIRYFTLCTDASEKDIEKIRKALERGDNPKDEKMRLARELISIYHNPAAALSAEENFVNTFKKGGIPDDTLEVEVESGTLLSETLLGAGIVESKTDFSRLIKEGAVSEVDSEEKITDRDFVIEKDLSLRIGKKRFLKIRVV